jgi:large subunit ribosomal protein L4
VSTVKKYSLKGEAVGDVALEAAHLEANGHRQMIKDYIIALRANARQWSANTRGRSEVAHTTKKPYKQKGTGNARQGMLVTPQFRGGGIVFGPKPKFDQHVRINRKERRLAIRTLLAEKIKANAVFVVDELGSLKKPQTKTVAEFLKSQQLFGRRVLFVADGDAFKKSVRNIPGAVFTVSSAVNGYEIASVRALVVTEKALKEMLKGAGES